MKTKEKETPVIDGKFEHGGRSFDCSHLIKRDKAVILREADSSHADTFDRLYDRDSLKAVKAKLNVGEDGSIEWLMIVYTIDYKAPDTSKRTACGDCYPFYELKEGVLFNMYPYQGSICW